MVYRLGGPAEGADVIATYRGLTLAGPARDFSIVHQLFGGYYEEDQVALFERLAAASSLVIDVGANIGLYSCVGAVKLPPGGHLVAFEPTPENLEYMKGNLERNGVVESVTVQSSAVGDRNGITTIYLAKEIGHHSVSAENAAGWTSAISVPMVSLDSYLEDADIGGPDLIKIDAEGYDGFVLRGARAIIMRDKPTLFVEYSPFSLANCGFSAAEFLDTLFTHYDHVFLIHDYRVRSCTREAAGRLSGGKGFYTNLLAVSRPEHLRIIHECCPELKECPVQAF
jgi:FkbM family methyltransferase